MEKECKDCWHNYHCPMPQEGYNFNPDKCPYNSDNKKVIGRLKVAAEDSARKKYPTEEEITKQLEEMDKEREITEGEKRCLYGKELYEFGKKIMESQEDTPESIKKVIKEHWWDML